jgi:hypothetical protein
MSGDLLSPDNIPPLMITAPVIQSSIGKLPIPHRRPLYYNTSVAKIGTIPIVVFTTIEVHHHCGECIDVARLP